MHADFNANATLGVGELPPLGDASRRVIESFWNGGLRGDSLAATLADVPGMERGFIRLANSPYYSTSFKISSINQAVAKMRNEHIHALAVTICVRDYLAGLDLEGFDLRRYMQMAFCQGIMGRVLADYLGAAVGGDCEQIFVVAALQDVGMPALYALNRQREQLHWRCDSRTLASCLDWEREAFGTDHRALGKELLRSWGFPEEAVRPLRARHDAEPQGKAGTICELSAVFARLVFEQVIDVITFLRKSQAALGLSPEVGIDLLIVGLDEVFRSATRLILDMDLREALLDFLRTAEAGLREAQHLLRGDAASPASPADDPLPSFETMPVGNAEMQPAMDALAHELRNPLMALGGFARRLAESLDPHSREGEYAALIFEEGKRLEEVFARLRAGSPG